MRVLALAIVLLPGLAAMGAELGPALDYPSFKRVDEVVAFPPKVGAKVSVFGLPRCLSSDDCMLVSDQGKEQRPFIRIDRDALAGMDRLRLVHCYDPGGEQCIAVIYGIAGPDALRAQRIWWRSQEP